MAEPFGERAPAHVFDGEEMQRFEKEAIVRALASAARQTGAKHRQRMRPIFIVHLRRHDVRPPIRSETYESRRIR